MGAALTQLATTPLGPAAGPSRQQARGKRLFSSLNIGRWPKVLKTPALDVV
jgi:hypothetical protein